MKLRRHLMATVVAVALAVAGSAILLEARERFHLIGLATPEEKFAGKLVWIITLTVLLVSATALGFFLSPSTVLPYAVAGVVLTAAALPLVDYFWEALAFSGLLGPFLGVLAGAVGARSGKLDDRGGGYIAFSITGWLLASAVLFVVTWAYAFFE